MKQMLEEDMCICAEWDGKGWSVCGVPCPEHNKLPKEEVKKIMEEDRKAVAQFMEDIKKERIKKQELNF